MDRLGAGRPLSDRIREAAGNAGILPGDPLGPVIEALADLPDEVCRQVAPVLVEMQELAARAERTAQQPISKEVLSELARRTGHQVVANIDRHVISLHRGVIGGAVAATVALVALGWMAAGWWQPRADVSGMSCEDQPHGGRVCYFWVTPPPQPAKPR